MIYKVGGEKRLIGKNQCDVICARNIFRRDDGELVPRNVAFEGDVCNSSTRRGAAHSHAVKHVREGQIVDVERLTGDFLPALFTRERFADGMIISHGLHGFSRFSYNQWVRFQLASIKDAWALHATRLAFRERYLQPKST